MLRLKNCRQPWLDMLPRTLDEHLKAGLFCRKSVECIAMNAHSIFVKFGWHRSVCQWIIRRNQEISYGRYTVDSTLQER